MSVLELRSSDPDHWELKGYATTWNQPYEVNGPRGPFREQISRGAFPGAVSGADRTALHVQHFHAVAPLATTRGGSLSFAEDDRGLLLTARLPKNETDVADAVSKVQRGVLDSMSVGMGVDSDSWSDDGSSRTIRRGKLFEVSLVHNPANPSATVTSVRGEEGEEIEVRMVGSVAVARSVSVAFSKTAKLADLGAMRRELGTQDAHLASLRKRDDERDAIQREIEQSRRNTDKLRRELAGNVLKNQSRAAQLASLGRRGLAFRLPDGTWGFPTDTVDALKESIGLARHVEASPKTPGSPDVVALRKYLRQRAIALGARGLLPRGWTGSSGHANPSGPLTP